MILIFILLLLPISCSSLRNVRTSYGDLRGISYYSFPTNQYVHIFKGIPYSQPLVGSRRFSLPTPPNSWTGVRDATFSRAACLQNASSTTPPPEYMDEDCLFLHIYTSDRCLESSSKCPVIFYLYGGDFIKGSPVQYPDSFIVDHYASQDVVFAMPSIRLGVFGSLLLSPSMPANLFAYDIIAALKYLQTEISNFGGNPLDVVMMGHSSGAAFVANAVMSKRFDPDKRLFQRGIVLSGINAFMNASDIMANSWEFVRRIGCGGIDNATSVDEAVECLRQKNTNELLVVQRVMNDEGKTVGDITFAEPFVSPGATLKQFFTDIPPRSLLVGTLQYELETLDDLDCLVFSDISRYDHREELLKKYESDVQNGVIEDECVNQNLYSEIVLLASELASQGQDVYLYDNSQPPGYRHAGDLYFIVGGHPKNLTDDERILLSFYSQLFVNFTKYGQPAPEWEKFDPTRRNFFNIAVISENGTWPHTENGYHNKDADYWLINMTQFDASLNTEFSDRPSQIIGTSKLPPKYSSKLPSKATSTEANPVPVESDWSIWRQWWFYALLALALILLSVMIYFTAKSCTRRNPETTPLIR